MNLRRAAAAILLWAGITMAAMADPAVTIERTYSPANDETTRRFKQLIEKRPNGELELFGMFTHPGTDRTTPVERFTLAVMWIGFEKIFTTPAVAAVEVDGEEIYKEPGQHGEEIDGNTIDESIAFDVTPEILRRMAGGRRVVVRADQLRITLSESHLAHLRELLRLAQ